MRCLVTGGSGFIGSHLVDALVEAGHDVANLDVKSPPASNRLASWYPIDLLDRTGVEALVADFAPDIIFNLAAVADIDLGADAMRPNTDGLRHLVGAARALPGKPRIVHASTQLVVGPEHRPTSPRDYAPYTVYGESKAQSEEILWDEANGLEWVILRPTTVWGPRHPSFDRSIWKYLKRRWYLLPTGIDPVRSYGYVASVVAQFVAAGTLPAAQVNHQVFYAGDEPIRSSVWLDGFSRALSGRPVRRIPGGLLRTLATLGSLSKRFGGPAPIDQGRLYRMTTDYPVPMEPTFAVLGRGPVSVEQGIAQTSDWLRHAGQETRNTG